MFVRSNHKECMRLYRKRKKKKRKLKEKKSMKLIEYRIVYVPYFYGDNIVMRVVDNFQTHRNLYYRKENCKEKKKD